MKDAPQSRGNSALMMLMHENFVLAAGQMATIDLLKRLVDAGFLPPQAKQIIDEFAICREAHLWALLAKFKHEDPGAFQRYYRAETDESDPRGDFLALLRALQRNSRRRQP